VAGSAARFAFLRGRPLAAEVGFLFMLGPMLRVVGQGMVSDGGDWRGVVVPNRESARARDATTTHAQSVAGVPTAGRHSSGTATGVLCSHHGCAEDETGCGATPQPWFQGDREHLDSQSR
jgi:hypothetical protein